ncbi:PAS domain S-box protein [Actinoplanes sp. NPDC051861]|uniref:PAS domain S-box protein n=1 Tax=Actinoplanes sp. NPDC051861 TaxID=3155170 RepID=UPI003442B4B0
MTVSLGRTGRYRVLIWRTSLVAAGLLGMLTLTGHLSGGRIPAGLIVDGSEMSPTGAVLTCAGAVTLGFLGSDPVAGWRRWAGCAAALVMIGIALVAVSAGLFDTANPFAQLGDIGPPRIGPRPMRSPIAFLLISLSLLTLDLNARRGHLTSQLLAAAAALVIGVGTMASLFGLPSLYWEIQSRMTPPPTQLCLLLLAAGVTAARPNGLAVQVFGSRLLGGRTVRRLAPAVAGVVILIGLSLALLVRTRGGIESMPANIVVSVLLLMLYVVLVRSGYMLNDADARRQRVIAELRGQRDFNDTVLTALIEGVLALAPDGTVLRANQRWAEITGYPVDEVVGLRPPYPWWPPEAEADRGHDLDALLNASRGHDFSTEVRHRDGELLPVLATVCPVHADGRVSMIIVTYRDLTDRDREQAERRRMSDELDHFFTLSQDLLCIASPDGYFTRVNPAWTQTFGYAVEELLDRPFIAFVHPDDIDRTLRQSRTITEGLQPTISFENRYRRRDGTYRWLSWNATPADGGRGIYAVARDVTEAKLAEKRFQQLVLSAPDAMVIFDATGAIQLINHQTEHLFGYPSDDLIGRPVETLLRNGHANGLRRYLEDPAPRSMGHGRELCAVRRDGSEFPVEVSLAPLETDEGMLVSAAIRDVSERRRTEQALATARDQALAAAHAKSQFVAMVSHEIRTPMNGVIGLTKLLLDTQLQPLQRRYGESIRASARALLAIINDILDFSKIEAGKITLIEDEFDIGGLIEQVANAGAAAAREKSLEVLAYYPADMPSTVRGDEGRLRQILLNLVGNAVKFTHRGEVVIRVDPQGAAGDGRRRFAFSVADTGIGIEPAQLARLFEPFTQADSTTSRQFGGTGLGLTISHQLVGLMGGQLEVDSEPGHGSRFSFTVPLTAAGQHMTGETRPDRDGLTAHRLLIVDANPTSRRFLTEHVHTWGMQVATTSTAGEALVRLRTAAQRGEPYDVAVLDHRPPNLDAVSLSADINADVEISPDPLCVLLSRDPSAETSQADRPGVDVLAKPVGPSTLYNHLLAHFTAGPVRTPGQVSGPPADARGGRGRILLAEDNEINQMVAVDTLATLGYETDIASNGAEAVELARSHEYQAILMDCQMPKLDGYQATEQLRHSEQPNQHTPIIAMTAGVLAEDRRRALQAGMDDFLAKPIDTEKLRATLDHWISG